MTADGRLSDRKGWATIIGTPKGKNEFWRMYQEAQKDPDWFHMMLRASDSGIIPKAELEKLIIFGQGSFAVSQAGEDGSFYVAIAHNMATGKGITFDGVRKIAGCTVPGRGGQMASSQILRHDRTVTKNEV